MNLTSVILSVVSVGLSLAAFWTAISALQKVKAVILRKNEQEDSQRLRDLIIVLNTAKEAAMRWECGADPRRSADHSKKRDLQHLRDAQDALLTKLPISWDTQQRSAPNRAADDIRTALVH